ncbi:hypothetical protein CHUAL_007301 [Chamberlinius hualienensis]
MNTVQGATLLLVISISMVNAIFPLSALDDINNHSHYNHLQNESNHENESVTDDIFHGRESLTIPRVEVLNITLFKGVEIDTTGLVNSTKTFVNNTKEFVGNITKHILRQRAAVDHMGPDSLLAIKTFLEDYLGNSSIDEVEQLYSTNDSIVREHRSIHELIENITLNLFALKEDGAFESTNETLVPEPKSFFDEINNITLDFFAINKDYVNSTTESSLRQRRSIQELIKNVSSYVFGRQEDVETTPAYSFSADSIAHMALFQSIKDSVISKRHAAYDYFETPTNFTYPTEVKLENLFANITIDSIATDDNATESTTTSEDSTTTEKSFWNRFGFRSAPGPYKYAPHQFLIANDTDAHIE